MKISRRAKMLLLPCLIILLSALFLLRWAKAQPQYGGHPLEYWVDAYSHANSPSPATPALTSFTLVTKNGKTTKVPIIQYPADYKARYEAYTALAAIGEKAVPYLRRQLKIRETRLTKEYRQCSILLPWSIRTHLPALKDRDVIRADAAAAVKAIGPAGDQLVPDLLEMLAEEDEWRTAFSNAIRSLKALAVRDKQFDPLLDYWNRRQRVTQIAALFKNTTLSTTNAALALCSLLESTNTSDQFLAQVTLRKIGPAASVATGQLIQALNSEDTETRYQSARTLEAVGTNATAAIAALEAKLSDSSVIVRSASLRALKEITGQP